MSTATLPIETVSLLRALDAIRNWRAYVLLLITAAASVVISLIFGYLSVRLVLWDMQTVGVIVAFVSGLLVGLVSVWGISASGVTLLDQAKGQPIRSLGDAMMTGLVVLPKMILLGLLLLALYFGIAVFVIMLFLVAKIPVAGPLVYFFAFPLATVLFGMLVFVMLFVVNALAAPAIWDGNGVMETVAKLLKVARQDLLKIMVSQSLLFLLVLFAAAMLAMILALGSSMAGGLSGLVLDVDVSNVLGRFSSIERMFNSSGDYIKAAGAGVGILFSAAFMSILLIYISGNCLLYLQYAAGVDASAVEQGLRNRMDDVRARAAAAQVQLRETAARHAESQRQTRAAAPTPNAAATCPQCRNPVTPDDVFCGNCGHRQPGHGG